MKPIYLQTTRDGSTNQAFHSKCDERGPTLTIIKSQENGCIFGGYNPFSWQSTADMWRYLGMLRIHVYCTIWWTNNRFHFLPVLVASYSVIPHKQTLMNEIIVIITNNRFKDAWIFSLKNPSEIPVKLKCIQPEKAIYTSSSVGPGFGSSDIRMFLSYHDVYSSS